MQHTTIHEIGLQTLTNASMGSEHSLYRRMKHSMEETELSGDKGALQYPRALQPPRCGGWLGISSWPESMPF